METTAKKNVRDFVDYFLKQMPDNYTEEQILHELSIAQKLEGFAKPGEEQYWGDKISEGEKKAIREGKKDLEEGRTYTSEEVWADYEQYF